MIVQQILKLKADDGVVTVPPGTDVSVVAGIMATRKIGTVVISPDGKQIHGIVSERDIVGEVSRNGNVCLIAPVDAIMTKKVVCCSRSDSSDEVLEKMTNGRFRHMPVVESDGMPVDVQDKVKAVIRNVEAHMPERLGVGL